MPVALVSAVAAALSYAVGMGLHLSMYVDALVKILVYLFIYLGWSFRMKPEAFTYTLSIIPSRFRIWERIIK